MIWSLYWELKEKRTFGHYSGAIHYVTAVAQLKREIT